MEPKRSSSDGGGNRSKRLKRSEVGEQRVVFTGPLKLSDLKCEFLQILEKKKAVEKLIGAAYSVSDHLASFPHFRHYSEKGTCS